MKSELIRCLPAIAQLGAVIRVQSFGCDLDVVHANESVRLGLDSTDLSSEIFEESILRGCKIELPLPPAGTYCLSVGSYAGVTLTYFRSDKLRIAVRDHINRDGLGENFTGWDAYATDPKLSHLLMGSNWVDGDEQARIYCNRSAPLDKAALETWRMADDQGNRIIPNWDSI